MPVLPAAFQPARERKQMSPTSESKDSQQMALGAETRADGFPVSQKKRLLGGRQRGSGQGRRKKWHVGVSPLAGVRTNNHIQMPKQSHDAEI